jgi:hypothetical protein
MKGITKAAITLSAAIAFAGCSSMTEIPERENYAQPDWYVECAQAGTEGIFWTSEDFVYACGSGQSRYQQAAEEQMYAIALNNFAKRVNGVVNSETALQFEDGDRVAATNIRYTVNDTRITQHLEADKDTYIFQGDRYTFVRLKMPAKVFEQLVNDNR